MARARSQLRQEPWQAVAARLLLGFASWHIVDSILSHWVLGIHRIRVDSANPLMWDVIWFAGFGIAPAAIALLMMKRPPSSEGGRTAHPARTVLLLALATTGLAGWSMRPPGDLPDTTPYTTIAFAPWISGADAIAAIEAAEGRLVWADPAMSVVVVAMPAHRRIGLYGDGALLVGGALMPAGCFGWSRPPA